MKSLNEYQKECDVAYKKLEAAKKIDFLDKVLSGELSHIKKGWLEFNIENGLTGDSQDWYDREHFDLDNSFLNDLSPVFLMIREKLVKELETL